MDLVPSLEQRDLVATVEAFAERELSTTHAHERAGEWGSPAVPVSDQTWSRLADLGVFALGLPEEAGGLDLPVVEEALVFRVLGGKLAPLGLLGSVLAARFANAAGDNELRDGLIEGVVRGGLALREKDGRVVVADLPGGGAVVRWTEQGAGLTVGVPGGVPVDSLEPTTILTAVQAGEFGPPLTVAAGEAAAIGATGSLLAAAMLVGNAEACRDLAVSYAKERVQFDKAIGVNQAVKHPCADMATRCEAASSQLFFAALALRDGRSDAAFHVAAAKRVAGRAAIANAHATVQIFGGMGFTWEHDAHLYVSRAQLLDRFAGTPHEQRDALLGTVPQIP